MPLKTPSFWQSRGWMSGLLTPFSFFYGLGSKASQTFSKPYISKLPVLCIGGAVAGGSGKTPVVQSIAKLVRDKGLYQHPVILLRGYGGALKGPTFVDPDHHDYKDVGDEALLHAKVAPVIISRNRADGARLAEVSGADLIIMDDGLQNTNLAKTWSFLVIDGAQKWGNGRILPAGPLRESLSDALSKCVGIIGTGGFSDAVNGTSVLTTKLYVPDPPDKTHSYFGFAGLGRPEKFRETLISQGYTLWGFEPFPDHHPYSDADMKMLLAKASGNRLITTAKDAVRIPERYEDKIEVLNVMSVFNDPDAFLSLWGAR